MSFGAIQNNWGWDMVNHTQFHVDSVQTYYDKNDLTGYASDVLQQAAWLEANGLNSAPNWIIYPHGDTNDALEQVVGRYYMFGRGVVNDPDSYPFGNPKDVNNLEIQYPGDGESGVAGYTPPAQILAAVKSAEEYHTTLLLTFHRIHSEPSDLPGYPLNLFEELINGIHASGIRVMTLSELDRSNGVPVNNHIYVNAGESSLITTTISGSVARELVAPETRKDAEPNEGWQREERIPVPGMNSGLSPDDPTLVAAFRSALLHQGAIALVIIAWLWLVWATARRWRLTTPEATAAADADGPAGRGRGVPEPRARRLLRVGFGVIWILDGILQAQPKMAAGLPFATHRADRRGVTSLGPAPD